MSRDPAKILKEALALPPEVRAALVDSLLETLDTEVDKGAEEAWQREILRRLSELDSNAVSTIPWAEARSRLMNTLRNGR
jgi:putative addiction module component (TIGR02574 family)